MTKIQLNIIILHSTTLKNKKSKALNGFVVFLTQHFNTLTKKLAK